MLGAVLRDLAFPKQMKWDATLDDGRGEFVFGRPIRWLLFLYGGRVVPFTIGRAANAAGPLVQDVESGALTYGHRFLATSGRAGRSIKVRSFDEYQARLKEHFIVLEHAERRDRIARDLEGHARRLNGRVALKDHHRLLDEVADLVEFPGVVAGFFDAALPRAARGSAGDHAGAPSALLPGAVGSRRAEGSVPRRRQHAAEGRAADREERRAGRRRRGCAMRGSSGRATGKTPLESRLDRLHTVLFHKKLGSYRDKAERIEQLAAWIAGEVLGQAGGGRARRRPAARLAKADLTTDMVFEFPELQGTMGGIYAREEGQPEAVWKAIYHHYLPIGVEADAPPSKEQLGAAAVTWAAVSLADKLDTVLGLYARRREERPARAIRSGCGADAQGAIRILMDLPELTGIDSRDRSRRVLSKASEPFAGRAADAGAAGLALGFGVERIRFALEQRGLPGRDRACGHLGQPRRAAAGAPPRRGAAADAHLGGLPGAGGAVQARQEHRQGAGRGAGARPRGADRAGGARAARGARREAAAIDAAAARADYTRAFTEIAALRPPVDRFFTEVFVMADDVRVRTARLTLMAHLRDLILTLADISEIVPHTE